MPRKTGLGSIPTHLGMVIVLLSGLLGFTADPVSAAGRVAYIYGSSADPSATAMRDLFVNMLTGKGLSVDSYDETTLLLAATDLSPDQAVIVADDAGATGGSYYQKILAAHKPVVAIGSGGATFFAQAGLTEVTGGGLATGASAYDVHAADPYAPIWTTPDPVFLQNQTKAIYSAAVNAFAFQAGDTFQFVTRIGRLPGDPNHYSIITQNSGGVCFTFWGYRGAPNLLTQGGVSLFYNLLLGSPCAEGAYTLTSALASTTPQMDGAYSYGEWPITSAPNTNLLYMDHGFVLAQNDNIRLYLLLDVLEANVNNPGPTLNDLMISFDVDNNAAITPAIDINYATEAGTHNLRYQFYNSPANWTLLSSSTKSGLGPGFDCFTTDGTKVLQISPPQFKCAAHQIFEVAINLHEIQASPGQTIHLGIRSQSPNPNFTDDVPNVFEVDFSNLITLRLAGSPTPPHDPSANIAFDTPPYEITQVVQDANNSIPLVADKTTAGRVSIRETGSAFPQPVIEYLYGQRGGNDLPGSPLVQIVMAPPAVDRGNIKHTANFLLPASWTTQGEVFFHAEGEDFNGHSIASGSQLLLFQHKQTPTYWIIQENMAAPNAPPDLLTQATLDSFTSYTRTVFPVPDITFIQKPWTALGALNGMNLNNNVAAVQKLYAATSAEYWNLINQNKVPNFVLPELIFGAGNMGGGLSDPTWNGGAGHAAAGGFASSGEGVVAHEFNHDLDRSSNGTWGRHVGACNASGPDPNWPFGSDPSIHEYGFDTRLPWQNSSSKDTVIPTSWPDLMSYCTSGQLPTKWVAPYRYKAWFGSSLFPTAQTNVQLNAAPVSSIYVSASLDAGGTGHLDPALLAFGQPLTPSASGAYSISLIGPGGTLLSHSFDETFLDVEGNPITTAFLNFVLPDPGGVTGIQLSHGAQVLATIIKSAAAPSVSFTNPGGDTSLSGTQAITWTLSDADTPLAQVSQTLEFSSDNGNTWMPVAASISGTTTSYALDTNLLPKTTSGKLRLLVTDGLNNVSAVSNGLITVANHPPQADIYAPLDQGFVAGGSQTLLQGTAYDVEDATLPDNNFEWKLDGSTVLGVGKSIQAVLPDGKHTLTLTALDNDGASGSASITVYVQQYRIFLPSLQR
jgi:hypothetical protein